MGTRLKNISPHLSTTAQNTLYLLVKRTAAAALLQLHAHYSLQCTLAGRRQTVIYFFSKANVAANCGGPKAANQQQISTRRGGESWGTTEHQRYPVRENTPPRMCSCHRVRGRTEDIIFIQLLPRRIQSLTTDRRNAAKKKADNACCTCIHVACGRAVQPARRTSSNTHAVFNAQHRSFAFMHPVIAYANACVCMLGRGCAFSRAAQSTAWCLKRVLSL